MRRLLFSVGLLALASAPAFADTTDTPLFPPHSRVWDNLTFTPPADTTSTAAIVLDQTAPPPKLPVVEYSDGYKVRAKIHRYSSFAMLPLVATELVLGNSIYNNPSEGKKGAHVAVGATIMGVFGVNTVTGIWNMMEARKDPTGRTRRLLHGILMVAADVGFIATAATAPGESEFERGVYRQGSGSRSTHRAIAITSLATATAGYLVMLMGGR